MTNLKKEWHIENHSLSKKEHGILKEHLAIVDESQEVVCSVSPISRVSDRDLANARLIASAPGLLEVLKLVENQLIVSPEPRLVYDSESILHIVSEAIEKAQGWYLK